VITIVILSVVLAKSTVRTLQPIPRRIFSLPQIEVSPSESALPKNRLVTVLESALPKTQDLKGDYSLDTINAF
jgi:hypothetical protein